MIDAYNLSMNVTSPMEPSPMRLVCSTMLALGLLVPLAHGGPPATRKEPVKDTYHGTTITDDYRWLEDWSNPQVKAWSEAQNAYARAFLGKLPGVVTLREELTKIM